MQIPHNENNIHPPMTGVLLAGGHSRRMGTDKALLTYRGEPLWQRCHKVLATCCEKLLIAGDRPDLAAENLPSFADAFPGSSMAGLHTGLTHAETDWITVFPCDLPWPSLQLLQQLQDSCAEEFDAVVPRTRLGREPLIACYHKRALQKITDRLLAGRPKLLDLLDDLNVRYLEEEELPPGWQRAVRNLNSRTDLERLSQPPPALTFIAHSGTGKTTLLEKLIAELTRRGWRIGALKHDAHKFEIDHEGKDSLRLTRAGAAVTAISSPAKTAIIYQHEQAPGLEELLKPFHGEVDIVLTEGFKQSLLPKIEVHRAELNRPLISRSEYNDPTLIGVASDTRLEIDVPCFDINDFTPLVTFIEETFLS